MVSGEVKIRENWCRRKAARQGLFLSKSNRRDPDALDYNLFVLCEPHNGNVVEPAAYGIAGIYGMTLEEVEQRFGRIIKKPKPVRKATATRKTIHERRAAR